MFQGRCNAPEQTREKRREKMELEVVRIWQKHGNFSLYLNLGNIYLIHNAKLGERGKEGEGQMVMRVNMLKG